MSAKNFWALIAYLSIAHVYFCYSSTVEITTFEGNLNNESYFAIDASNPHAHSFTLKATETQTYTNARIEVTVLNEIWTPEALHCPLIFSLRHHQSSRSWALPQDISTATQYQILRSARFTVCLSEIETGHNVDQSEFLIFVSTCSENSVNYTLLFNVSQSGFMLQKNAPPVSTVVSPSWHQLYRFNFPEETDEVIVQVESSDSTCMTAAVQSPSCQLLSGGTQSMRDGNKPFKSLWQDMTSAAVIPVKKYDFPNGFFIGFEVYDDDERCESYRGVASSSWDPVEISSVSRDGLRQKNISIRITEDLPVESYRLPLFVPLFLVISVGAFTLLVYSLSTWAAKRTPLSEDRRVLVLNDELSATSSNTVDTRRRSTQSQQSGQSDLSADIAQRANPFNATVSSTTTVPVVSVGTSRNGQHMATYKGWLTIESFMNKKKKLKKSLRKLHLLIFSIGIFYVLPTIQLLYTYHQISKSTGQNDLCYRNYLCSEEVFGWDDFNHIYSNSVYIVLGLIFCGFVLHYHDTVERIETAEAQNSEDATGASVVEPGQAQVPSGRGVLHQFGVFYALGLSLCLEGILSGAYHVCPTEMNYQFDTSFMYILAALCTIRIYQFRHPDPICPHNTFSFLALISSVSVGGILLGSQLYESAFLALQIIVVLMVSIYMYYVGYILDDEGFAITDYSLFGKTGLWSLLRRKPWTLLGPRYKSRLLFVIPLILYNIGICLWQIAVHNEFPTYLIYLFAGNMMLYFVHYFIMKAWHGELFHRLAIQPMVYLFLSGAFGILAMQYFADKRYDSSLSPAMSRVLNRPCIVTHFYDSHDMWHFLSATAIFFFFMALLTIDDAILKRPRNEIVAF